MSRILITGSTDGLGLAAASSLLDDGHEVIAHARSTGRLSALDGVRDRGAQTVVGDLARIPEVQALADQVEALDALDAVIHNAGTMDGPSVLMVNVVAPYLLSARLPAAPRQIFLSSSKHRGGRADLAGVAGIDWTGADGPRTYSDSKLYVTALMAAVARLRPDRIVHAVDPGWVPTRMGGPGASDELELGHVTQAWLAVSHDPQVLRSGAYWRHQRIETPHEAVHDVGFQDALLDALAEYTGVTMTAD